MQFEDPKEVNTPGEKGAPQWNPIALLEEGRTLGRAAPEKARPVSFNEKLEKRMKDLPEAVRNRIEGLVDRLASEDEATRSKAKADLQDYKQAAIPFLLRNLGSEKFPERKAADDFLRSMGADAVPGLFTAKNSDDLEVKTRATRLLNAMERSGEMDVMKDEAGRLRRLIGEGEVLVSAEYRDDGVLIKAKTGDATFKLLPDGKYINTAFPKDKYDNVSVDEYGTLRVSRGGTTNVWGAGGTSGFDKWLSEMGKLLKKLSK
jgi:hypothetical protein